MVAALPQLAREMGIIGNALDDYFIEWGRGVIVKHLVCKYKYKLNN